MSDQDVIQTRRKIISQPSNETYRKNYDDINWGKNSKNSPPIETPDTDKGKPEFVKKYASSFPEADIFHKITGK